MFCSLRIPLVRLFEIFERVVLKMKENLKFKTNNFCFIERIFNFSTIKA